MNSPKVIADQRIDQLVEKAIDFHCHGVGSFDFTEIHEIDLYEIESILASRKQQVILTLYLPKNNFNHFVALMDSYYEGKKAGRFQHIIGLGLEGPLLASHGGTPEKGVWMPTKEQWLKLSDCGKKGLIYVILSPDANLDQHRTNSDYPTNLTWIVETLLSGGVLPAPGHFTKINPVASAQNLQLVFDIVANAGFPTITDHLYNDMPHNFKHAWRTIQERSQREEEIAALNLNGWDVNLLDEQLGPVPAVMIRNALKGRVKICQNFDGEHVDLAIVKRTIEIIGAENMLLMTDSIESKRLAGRQLHQIEDSTLLYQDEGIVAAGSQNVFMQISNMFKIELNLHQIKLITHSVPAQVISQHNSHFSKVLDAETLSA